MTSENGYHLLCKCNSSSSLFISSLSSSSLLLRFLYFYSLHFLLIKKSCVISVYTVNIFTFALTKIIIIIIMLVIVKTVAAFDYFFNLPLFIFQILLFYPFSLVPLSVHLTTTLLLLWRKK